MDKNVKWSYEDVGNGGLLPFLFLCNKSGHFLYFFFLFLKIIFFFLRVINGFESVSLKSSDANLSLFAQENTRRCTKRAKHVSPPGLRH